MGLKFAYADPPYYGMAVKFYGDLHPEAAIYDTLEGHQALIDRLLPWLSPLVKPQHTFTNCKPA